MLTVLHFIPYASAEMLRKALLLKADALVLDLEDSVTPDNKDSARITIVDWLKHVDFGPRERIVRINALDSPWGNADVEATMAGCPDGYLVPKAGAVEELRELDQRISALEKHHGHPAGTVKLFPIIETPKGVLNVSEIAFCPRVVAICGGRGGLDMAAALGAWRVRDDRGDLLEIFRLTGTLCLLAAAAGGVQPIDSVLLLGDLERMHRECRESAEMGCTGWITIHPSQIDVVHEACFPTAAEIAESRDLVAAFEENRKLGKWAFRFKGQMVDVPNLKRAHTILERARAKEENDRKWQPR
ncbi:MAG TPA: CoA ester lyase [Candidatus Binataceae bacterium]|nr:CoA ester lyase [Candidatus Binataceae bacterium]